MILQPSRSTHLPYTALFRSLPLYLKGAGRSTLARPWFEWSVPVIALATRAGPRSRGAIGKRFGVRALIPFFLDRKSTRLNSSHTLISHAVLCLTYHTQDHNL